MFKDDSVFRRKPETIPPCANEVHQSFDDLFRSRKHPGCNGIAIGKQRGFGNSLKAPFSKPKSEDPS
jgi:hypothetical protein